MPATFGKSVSISVMNSARPARSPCGAPQAKTASDRRLRPPTRRRVCAKKRPVRARQKTFHPSLDCKSARQQGVLRAQVRWKWQMGNAMHEIGGAVSGSTIQRWVLSDLQSRRFLPSRPYPGRAVCSSSRIMLSAFKSAFVTKSPGPFCDTCSFQFHRNHGAGTAGFFGAARMTFKLADCMPMP